MSLEQLAILGIGIFGFIALVQAFNTVRNIKRSSRGAGQGRPRRPVGSADSALTMARGLVREVRSRHESLASQARETGQISGELEEHLEEARRYYRERVESRLRPLFHQAVNELILDREPPEGSDEK